MTANKAGRVLANILGIDLEASTRHQTQELHDHVAKSISPYEPYYEEDPTVKEWLLEKVPTKDGSVQYVMSLFPFTKWILRYNTRWLVSDAIAGVTLGLVAIPQAVAYALLARLSPEYGLYTSFTGAALYWIFGTSKDMAVGATAVVSLLVGKISARVLDEHPGEFTPEDISKALSFLSGAVLLALGLLRLDWLVELIPHVAISAFVTSAAITIALGQLPSLLGIEGVNSKAATYRVLIDTARDLPRARPIDAAVGLTALALLATIKWFCERMAKKCGQRAQHRQRRAWEMVCSLRMTFTIVLYTLVSFLVNRDLGSDQQPRFRITGKLPVGFTHAGPPSLSPKLISTLLPDLPTTVIIIVIEHIAIGKSFGRANNYTIHPSQELVSVGATNLLGPFLGAYASTGSFGGTAILSKAGVRTPLAGLFNAAVLLLALYALTSALYYIPLASLAALIIHAVANLVTAPDHIFRSWLASPPDVVIYFVGVFVSLFTSLENGIYATVAMSVALLLLRLARARGRFLGRVRVHRHDAAAAGESDRRRSASVSQTTITITTTTAAGAAEESHCDNPPQAVRDVFLPLDRKDGTNPAAHVSQVHPGVFIYRFTEGLNYLNQAQHLDRLLAHVTASTRRTTTPHYDHPGDRPWNEPPVTSTSPSSSSESNDAMSSSSSPPPTAPKPLLRAIVLDCSALNNVDSGAVEGLIDLRNQLDRWAAPGTVEWHFAGLVGNRWTRRALSASGGFGCPADVVLAGWEPVFTLAELTGVRDSQQPCLLPGSKEGKDEAACGVSDSERSSKTSPGEKEEGACDSVAEKGSVVRAAALGPLSGVNRPFFHVDLVAAVENAVRNAARRDRDLGGLSG